MAPEEAAHADGILAASHLAGSSEAFEELFERYFDRLSSYCGRVGGREGSEDLAQEALIRAWANLDRFEKNRPMWPWLKAIAANLARDRARATRHDTPLDPKYDEAVFDRYERFEEHALLSEAMRNLTPSQRTALRLRYIEDWSTEDTARFLGLSVPALKQLAYRARQHLRAEYRRLNEGALGWVLLPVRAIRDWLRIPGARIQRGAARVGSKVSLVGDGGYQLAIGMLGLTLALGGGVPPVSPERPDIRPPPVAASHRISARAAASSSAVPNAAGRRTEVDPSHPSSVVAPASATQQTKPGRQKAGHAAVDLVEDLTDPNAEIWEPEDAQLWSLVLSPGFAADRTVFASGNVLCERHLCPSVLFRSIDGGVTWTRDSAYGLVADTLLLPSGYGSADDRIFAMGVQGLQVSNDDGRTFRPAPIASGPRTWGPAAVSPIFNNGDPSILIGADTLLRYRDDAKMLEPVPSTATRGPFEPAYSPTYAVDRVILLGGNRLDLLTGVTVASVYRCVDGLCSSTDLEGETLRPKIRFASDFHSTRRVYAFTQGGIFASQDGGLAFSRVPVGWSGELLRDVVVDAQGRLLAGTVPEIPGGRGGLYLSSDGGLSWTEVKSELFASGVISIAASGNRVVVGLAEGGVACSSDGGSSWAPRCEPAPSP
jgi:RNA polymerase sigma-70 factor (ECF subfamily)